VRGTHVRTHDVPHRHDADQLSLLVDSEQVAEVALDHLLGGGVEVPVRGRCPRLEGHARLHLGCLGVAPLGDRSHHVALGDDARPRDAFVDHHRGAHAALQHQASGLSDRDGGPDQKQVCGHRIFDEHGSLPLEHTTAEGHRITATGTVDSLFRDRSSMTTLSEIVAFRSQQGRSGGGGWGEGVDPPEPEASRPGKANGRLQGRFLPSSGGRSSLRAWLYRIATNRCLNSIRDTKRRAPPAPVPPFEPPEPSRRGEVTWLQPYPDAWLDWVPDPAPGPSARYQAREAVRLAFVAALQRLPPRQTAVVVLCDVLDFSLAEVATMLEATPAAVKGLLQRARASLERQHLTGADPAPVPGSTSEVDLAQRFADAFSSDDVDTLVALLTDDAWLAMPPAPHEYHGAEAITRFLRASTAGRAGARLGLASTRANAQPAFVCYLGQPDDPAAQRSGLVVLTLSGDRIAAITRFLDPELPSIFGFGNALAGTGGG